MTGAREHSSPLEGEEGARPARAGKVRGYSRSTLHNAKALRRNITDAERRLWSLLRNSQLRGAKFRRQQPIGHFIADFVCHESRLIVEVDGGQHANGITDIRRTAYLESHGYRVLRFWNNDVLSNLEGVVQVIAAAISTPHPAQAAPESPSPSRGEGFCGASHA